MAHREPVKREMNDRMLKSRRIAEGRLDGDKYVIMIVDCEYIIRGKVINYKKGRKLL
jgi:hypothetical protein